MGGRGIKGFLKDRRAQMVGTPLKIVIAVVIGVAVLGILLQMMNLVNIMQPHSFTIDIDAETNSEGDWTIDDTTSITVVVYDATDGSKVEGAIVELRGAGASEAKVTRTMGQVTLNPEFIFTSPYEKTTITVSKEGYSKWTQTYLVKQ